MDWAGGCTAGCRGGGDNNATQGSCDTLHVFIGLRVLFGKKRRWRDSVPERGPRHASQIDDHADNESRHRS